LLSLCIGAIRPAFWAASRQKLLIERFRIATACPGPKPEPGDPKGGDIEERSVLGKEEQQSRSGQSKRLHSASGLCRNRS
jgi:hypothetical protein